MTEPDKDENLTPPEIKEMVDDTLRLLKGRSEWRGRRRHARTPPEEIHKRLELIRRRAMGRKH